MVVGVEVGDDIDVEDSFWNLIVTVSVIRERPIVGSWNPFPF